MYKFKPFETRFQIVFQKHPINLHSQKQYMSISSQR